MREICQDKPLGMVRLEPPSACAEVRATVGTEKWGSARGVKGGRKANIENEHTRGNKPASVPSRKDKQAGDKSWNIYGAVWSNNMLIALKKG